MANLQSTTTLHNGVEMPWLGFGVFKVDEGEEVIESVKAAIKAGYKSIDTAAIYGNEEGVGKAIAESDIARDELFITSKVWNSDHGYEETLAAFETSLKKLDLDYLDLYLIHWPVPEQGKYKETWKALEKLYKDGRVRAIGVSNFKTHHLEDLLADCEIKPMVNQVEYHPIFPQQEVHEFCKNNQIQLEAWSPLAQGKLIDNQTLKKIGDKYGKSPAQVTLRWVFQNEVVTIPKSTNSERIAQNADIFDFELTQEDMDNIATLDQGDRLFADPDEMNKR